MLWIYSILYLIRSVCRKTYVLERVVSSRLIYHLENNNLIDCLQSTETALLKVRNGLLQVLDKGSDNAIFVTRI